MTPGDAIRECLESKGWTQADLSQIIGKPVAAINEIVQGKRGITPEMAIVLASAFGNGAGYWMGLDAAYWIANSDIPTEDVAKRAKLFELAPIKDMQRRGWIKNTSTVAELEDELKRFFHTTSLHELPDIAASTRRSEPLADLNASQKVWCVQCAKVAKMMPAGRFSATSVDRAIRELKKLITWPEEARKVSRVLADVGIRCVVVEHLPRTKIDGAAFWLDEASPVIALSLRFDRIDSFWHTLGHEMSHIKHRDKVSVDTELVGESRAIPTAQSDIELRADRESAATWISDEDMNDFITRISPLYDRVSINQFANRLRVHPGVIVGQLQHRGELAYGSMRHALVKIRHIVVAESMTDGWGHSIEVKG